MHVVGHPEQRTASIRTDLTCDGTVIFGADINPCGATNRITSLNSLNYNYGPVVGPANFWYARVAYTYTAPTSPPSTPPVPLPAAAWMLISTLAGMGLMRRNVG